MLLTRPPTRSSAPESIIVNNVESAQMVMRRGAPRARPRPGMALALLAAMAALMPAGALAAKSAKAPADPPALDLGDFVGRLRGFLPRTHFEWADLGRTLLLHVDYWILIAVAFAFARRLTQRAADRKLRRVKAAMAYARHRDATYTSVETGMLEWINHLLRHEWRAVLSAAVDKQARVTMERAMRDAPSMTKGVVRRAVVEEATFGVVPPDLKLYVSRYNPAEDYLQFEFDFRWDTVSSHIVIKADVSVPGSVNGHARDGVGGFANALLSTFARAVPSARVPIHVTDLSVAGRLLLGLRLSNRAPGVSGVDVSFDGKPDVSVSVRPAGVPLNDIPYVREFVEQKIGETFAASYVEPRRYFQDVEGLFLKELGPGVDAQDAGPGGALVVDVRNAERLPARTHEKTKTACPYVELTYGGVTRRTPTRLNTTDPDWSARLVFPLPSKSSGEDIGGRFLPLRARVMDWSPLGEPRCIGAATQTVDLGRLRAAAERAAAARPGSRVRDAAGGALGLARHALSLRGTRGGVLHLSLGVVDAGKDKDASETNTPESTSGRGGGRAGEEELRDVEVEDVWGDGVLDERGEYPRDEDGEEDDRYEDDFGAGTPRTPRTPPLGRDEAPETLSTSAFVSDAAVARRASTSARSSADAATTLGNVSDPVGSDGGAAASRLVRLAKAQKARREETEAQRRALARLSTSLRETEESLSMEKERRGLELRRALVEGAAFTVHTKRKPGFEPGTYRLWYVASKQHIVWAKGAKPGSKPKLHQFVPVCLVKECVPGIDAFTLGADGDPAYRQSRDEAAAEKAAKKKKKKKFFRKHNPMRMARRAARNATSLLVKKQIGHHDPARCFSLVLWKPDAVENNLSDTLLGSGAAGMGLATIDLELPEGGNGRGAREWCDAITAVAEENGGGRLDPDDDDDEDEDEDAPCEVIAGAEESSDAKGRRVRSRSQKEKKDETNAVAAAGAAGASSEDTAPLRRQVSLPKRAEGDDASEDMGGEMLTIPIPPESVEEDPRAGMRASPA